MLRKLSVLFTLFILLGCNQSDSNNNTPSSDKTKTDTQSNWNENAGVAENEPERVGKVIARVNGQPIYEDEVRGKDLDFAITEEIIYQDAIKRGIDKEYRDEVRIFERKLIIRKTKQRILENADPTKEISDEEINHYYELNKEKYSLVRIHEISFEDSKLGNAIKDKAESGEELQNIANSYPDLRISVNDIGYDRQMSKHFKTIEVGAVSEVIQKPNGTFSILKIVEVKDMPLKNSKQSIKYILKAKGKADMIDRYARKAAEESNITIEIIEQENER
jgi:hypothetical protein